MKMTPFGEAARLLRMRHDLSLKAMADGMGISSAYLSAIEYGDKRLAEKHIQSALLFFADKATPEQINILRDAAERSKDIVSTSQLTPDARGLVAAFARRLSDGSTPPSDLVNWIKNQG